MLRIEWGGETLELWPERAAHWPRARTLLIADPHFGKGACFRQAGMPVPSGASVDDLEQLSRVLRRTRAERLIVLGDFLHAEGSQGQTTLAALLAWRQRHRALTVVLVEGNHDRRAGQPAGCLGINTVAEPLVEMPLAFCHEPGEHGERFVLAGHVHPGVTLRDAGGTCLRSPCFLFGERLALLPAFGRFTGCHWIRPKVGDRVFVVGPDAVVEVS